MKKIIILFLLIGIKGFSQTYHTLNFGSTNNFEGLQELQRITNSRVVLSGENHLYRLFNCAVELKLLKYLHQYGFSDLVLEFGESRAYFINQYLQYGDTLAWKYLKANTDNQFLYFYSELKKWNDTLKNKITIHGIDCERFSGLEILRLTEIFEKYIFPRKIYSEVNELIDLGEKLKLVGEVDSNQNYREYINYQRSTYSLDRILTYISHKYDSFPELFNTAITNEKDRKELKQVMNNISEYLTFENNEDNYYQGNYREEVIFQKIKKLIQENPNGKFYGQFGKCHTIYQNHTEQCNFLSYQSVMEKMRTRLPDSIKIANIDIVYPSYDYDRYYDDKSHADSFQNALKKIAKDAKNNAVQLVYTGDLDSMDYGIIQTHFNYLLINKFSNFTIGEFAVDGKNRKLKTDIFNYGNYKFLQLGAMNNNYNFSKINSFLSSFNAANIPSRISSYGGAIGGGTYSLHCVFEYHTNKYKTLLNDDNKRMIYKNSNTSFYLGTGIGKGKWSIDLQAGPTWNRFKIKTQSSSVDTFVLFENQQNKLFINEAILLSTRVGLSLYFGGVGIKFTYGRMWDFSDKNWYILNSKTNLPNTSLANGFFGAHLVFRINTESVW